MTERILKYGDPTLKTRSENVASREDLVPVLHPLMNTLLSHRAIGLSAVQIGLTKRVFAMVGSQGPRVFVNPEIVWTDGEAFLQEGCLSFPGAYETLMRAERIRLRWVDPADALKGDETIHSPESVREADFRGIEARCILHEVDHLDGLLMTDHMGKTLKTIFLGRYKKRGGK
jgi:peptide deformylase